MDINDILFCVLMLLLGIAIIVYYGNSLKILKNKNKYTIKRDYDKKSKMTEVRYIRSIAFGCFITAFSVIVFIVKLLNVG